MSHVKHAIILAGGKGERLRPLTDGRPKSMVEVAGVPILDYQLKALREGGVEEVVLTVSYLKEVIQDHVGDGDKHGIKATYSVEETPLGRGGAIKQAMKQIGTDWEDAIALNGDNLWQVDFEAFVRLHRDRDAIATVLVAPLRSPYGIVDFNENDEILGFREKPELPFWMNAGMYVMSREIEPLLPDVGDHEDETFPYLPRERFLAFRSRGYWRGIDTVKDVTEAETEVAEIFGRRGERFAEPFISRVYRNGRELTDKEYREAGLTPPTAAQKAEFDRREREGL